ncbi:MAG: hypothetical protein II404_06795 [Prevotella sp.]|nr:hypothetical protein [Prevotella sp.]
MQKKILWIVVFVLCRIGALGQAGYFIPSERFSSGLINDICQDRYGYLWIATDYGLNKFDGYRFTQYLHHPDDSTTMSSNVAGCLFCDKDGQLWIGTSKGLDRYNYATDEFVHYRFEGGIYPRVSKIAQTRDGRLVACTSGFSGLYAVDGQRAIVSEQRDPDISFTNSILEDSHGRFWQCGFGNDFSMRDGEGLHRMTSTQGFVVDFAERDGEVLIIGLHGIHSYRDGQLSVADIDMKALAGEDVIIRRVFKDHLGNIYIGTRGRGLFCLAKDSRRLEQVECIARNMDLTTAKVWAVSEDRNGNLWIGCQSKGLMKLRRTPPLFQSWEFTSQGIELGSTVSSLCEGDGGITWCTVQGNGVYGFDEMGRIVAHPASPKPSEFIFRDRNHRYWIGTDDGLYAYNPLTGQSRLQVNFDCDRFNDMTDDGSENIYISTFSRGFCVFNTTTRQLRNFSSEMKDQQRGWLCNDWVMAMMPDRQGRIWLALRY